jgi:hypothetical protein
VELGLIEKKTSGFIGRIAGTAIDTVVADGLCFPNFMARSRLTLGHYNPPDWRQQ